MGSDVKKLHDVASVKKQLANTIAANDDSASNDYYYSTHTQDMLDYVVNNDFNSMNDKSGLEWRHDLHACFILRLNGVFEL